MRIYLADFSLDVLLKYHELYPERRLNVLRSFGTPSKDTEGFLRTHRDKIGSLILDSGTWTLNNRKTTGGMKITLEGYKNYAQDFGNYFDFYFNFDSNFTDEGFGTNISNQVYLEDAGLRPVPVIHDIYGDEIPHYIERKYPLVALGSAQITDIYSLQMVVDRLQRAGIQIHLFGNTTFEFLSSLPIYSCDSTSWAKTAAFGEIKYWNPRKTGKNKTDEIHLEEYLNALAKKATEKTISRYPFRKELEEYLDKELGISGDDLYKNKFYQWLVNTHYYVELEERITLIHQQKGFNTDPKW